MASILSMLKYIFNYETWYYPPLNNAKHLQLFGRGIHTLGINRRKAAYKRACALRDFEITYFWRRSKYFWGFISIVLGAYTAMSVSEFRSEIAELHLDFCLLIVGLLFTIIWLLVLLGSKAWYEHWEYMICFLEDAITGPLYKTGSYSRSRNYYSVSKLNIMLVLVFIFMWLCLLIQYLCNGYTLSLKNTDMFVTVVLFITVVFIIALVFGYPKASRTSDEGALYNQWGDCRRLAAGFVRRSKPKKPQA